ncbi:hypothetical protein [Brevibacillus sp. DP1.3A]|uniref:hypothetical protein n=1 Tax=Brevibacillus sp. DP1.3A TaxID=2738867 RepID=UPI00156BCE0A|nr:hypothetical protein [Brevibacillus sp. DP1.3A]UED78124.1 hypothetical protein HP399_031015 [Brevibacillus sp. DP1.3A]
MGTIKGVVNFRFKKTDFIVAYEIKEGLITLDKSDGFPEEVYRKAYDKVAKENNETIDKMLEEYFQKEKDKDTEIENESFIENEVKKENRTSTEEVAKLEKVTKKENDSSTEKDAKIEMYEKRIKELEEELRRKKGGRPSIGETRKVSLTLPDWMWADIDRTVRITGTKQSAWLRQLLMVAHADYGLKKGGSNE